MAFGYKHVMQRHIERHHHPSQAGSISTSTLPLYASSGQEQVPAIGHAIGLITGQDYHESRNPPKANATHRSRVIACPWPDAFGAKKFLGGSASAGHSTKCAFIFSRAYDLRRHLRSAHGLDVDAHEVSAWVLEYKY
jgi:general transcription factor IIIA